MDKRYQVFISSTFVDLVDERREVMQALLEMDCMPAGMELFPAANEDQWTLIKGVIEQSDYYLVVLGGRYGSMTEEGISYTEKEYDYAVELGIPVMGFVIADPDAIPQGKTDKSDAAAAKLDEFRAKVQTRMTKAWRDGPDLAGKVALGLTHLIKKHPRPGWVRGDQAMTAETRVKIAELEKKVAQFEKKEIETSSAGATQINENMAHGSEEVELSFRHKGLSDFHGRVDEIATISYAWDDLVSLLGPFMIHEASETMLRETMDSHIFSDVRQGTGSWSEVRANEEVSVTDSSWGAIILQLRAVRLITNGTKKRGVSDKAVYWKLTQAGDDYLVALRAVPSAAKQEDNG